MTLWVLTVIIVTFYEGKVDVSYKSTTHSTEEFCILELKNKERQYPQIGEDNVVYRSFTCDKGNVDSNE